MIYSRCATKLHRGRILVIILLIQICISGIPAKALGVKADKEPPIVINITDFGALPDSRKNTTPIIRDVLEKYKGKSNLKIIFPGGRYDFWQDGSTRKVYFESNTVDNNPKSCPIYIYKMRDLIIDGQHSTFVFHGQVQPFTVDSSENITIQNVKIDWDIPLTAQAKVQSVTKNSVDINIDSCQYPFEIIGGKLFFLGEGWKSIWKGVMEYDHATGNIVTESGDQCLGKGWNNYTAVRTSQNTVRLQYPFLRQPAVNNYLILRHSPRDHSGIFIVNSKEIYLENMTIHYACGLGTLAQYSQNLYFKDIEFIPNRSKNRYFSGHADGFHISNCKGEVVIDSCKFQGLMDDPINVHGTTVKIIGKKNDYGLICRFMRPTTKGFRWADPQDTISFITHGNMQAVGKGIVREFKALSVDTFEISFTNIIPSSITSGDALENLSWAPDVTIRNSLFDGSNRARGVLVSTPGKVMIENNVFNSSGSAILIAGDANYWYESGAVKDVTIRNNEFINCLTSLYQFCEAVISIEPEIPVLKPGSPAYHRNIRILNNTFRMFDYPVLYAKSVDGLKFVDNTLIRSYAFKPFHNRKAGIALHACYRVEIEKNRFIGDVLGNSITVENMNPGEVKLSSNGSFKLTYGN